MLPMAIPGAQTIFAHARDSLFPECEREICKGALYSAQKCEELFNVGATMTTTPLPACLPARLDHVRLRPRKMPHLHIPC